MADKAFQKGGLFNGANPLLFARAKELRNTMTEAEIVLWSHLKSGIDGLKFRRQHPLGCYIADFYCHKAHLVIEVDGSVHNEEKVKEQDRQKQHDLERNGYIILRFTNKQVMSHVDQVVNQIKLTVHKILNNHY